MKYLFEVSWEVCNLVGGIYTVLRSKTPETISAFGDNYFLVGPMLENNSDFEETDEPEWGPLRAAVEAQSLKCRFGRWQVDGRPKVILVEFNHRYNPEKILFNFWQQFGVDSLTGGWDYVEPVLFSTACGEVIEAINEAVTNENDQCVAHFHEWMSGGGLLYLKKHAPEIGTVFTTHATILGRSMAGSGFNIYSEAREINPTTDARDFGVAAKYSMEAVCAREADSFTTVSNVTADEAAVILEQRPHFVVGNGVNAKGLPKLEEQLAAGHKKRKDLLEIASQVLNKRLPTNTHMFITSGRYEFHNKGFDCFLEALSRLDEEIREDITIPPVVAWFAIATDNSGAIPPEDNSNGNAVLTHHVHHKEMDPILKACRRLGLMNDKENKVHIIFTPAYLDGEDGVINAPYTELIAGFDLGVFPSFYEPWGYTPLECSAAGVPTVTTDLAGFGAWIVELGKAGSTSVEVIKRAGRPDETTIKDLTKVLSKFACIGTQRLKHLRTQARKTAEQADWKVFFRGYLAAYEQAFNTAEKRLNSLDTSSFSNNLFISYKREDGPGPHFQTFRVAPKLPNEIDALLAIAHNMWWCWHPDAQTLFKELAPETWKECKNNPVRLLGKVPPEVFVTKVNNPEFMKRYAKVVSAFEEYMGSLGRYGQKTKHINQQRPVVYFSMEFGLHECLPIYSGGLGILSGDHLKAASDLGVPLLGIGLLYKQGYFEQRIDRNGNQHEGYPLLDTANAPVVLLRQPNGKEVRINVPVESRTIHARVWTVDVGRVKLYLLDTDVEENRPRDRHISAQLYGGDRTTRIEQEILLGFGGVQLAEDILEFKPAVYHLNEGHCGFMLFERVRRFLEKGLDFQQAREAVKATSVFTTHTPVPAGNEAFDHDIMTQYFSDFAPKLGISFEQLLELGLSRSEADQEPFSMTVLALKLTCQSNGVSKLHGAVCREMWKNVWRGVSTEEVPIGSITNGIHITSWIGEQMRGLYEKYLDIRWDENHDAPEVWKNVDNIPDDIFWHSHEAQKLALFDAIKEKVLSDYVVRGESSALIKDTLDQLNPKALTIGFARRFATYKRAGLLFQSRESLVQLLNNKRRPIQIIFAGKAHPADPAGKELIKRVIEESRSDEFRGKILYMENYNMALGRLLTQGVDVWLNTPVRPHEASGTSGMKVVPNGGLNCSIMDGWWDEAYTPDCGWAIWAHALPVSDEHRDEMDHAALMAMLEYDIANLYYDENDAGIPVGWVYKMKSALKQLTPVFSTMRMVEEYHQKMYLNTAQRGRHLAENEFSGIKQLTEWKRKIGARFSTVAIDHITVTATDVQNENANLVLEVELYVSPGKLTPEELQAELVIGLGDGEQFSEEPDVVQFDLGIPIEEELFQDEGDNVRFDSRIPTQPETFDENSLRELSESRVPGGAVKQLKYRLFHKIKRSGGFMYAVRIVPVHALLSRPQETGLVLWA